MVNTGKNISLKAGMIVLAALMAVAALAFQVQPVKAAAATTCFLSITPTTVEQSGPSQPPTMCTITVSLNAGGTPLPGRDIDLYYRAVGTLSWTFISPVVTDGNGYFTSPGFPPQMVFAGGGYGDYEVRAVFTPVGADVTVYDGSESSIVTVTVLPHPVEATTINVSISPSVVEHSSSVVPLTFCTITVLLNAGGTPLPGRNIDLYYRAEGSPSWILMTPVVTDANGSFTSPGFPPEMVFSGGYGDYEVRAVFTPAGGDVIDFTGSEDICSVTITPSSIDMAFVTVSGHLVYVSHASTTGITVTITDSSLSDGFNFNVTTRYFGRSFPPGTNYFFTPSNLCYDVQVLPTVGGPVGPDVMVAVEITDATFDSYSRVKYWSGSAWVSVDAGFIAPHTVTFSVPASLLTGTPFVVYLSPPISVGGKIYVINKQSIAASQVGTGLLFLLTLTGAGLDLYMLKKKRLPGSSKR